MAVDAEWIQRNLASGIAESESTGTRRSDNSETDQSIRRRLIDFDSEGPTGEALKARTPEAAIGLSHYVPISWPDGLAPDAPDTAPVGDSLPPADVLIATWTLDEGHALSQVMTPGIDSNANWKPYTKNFDVISKMMIPDCPAQKLGRLGTYWTTRIGTKQVTLFKSDSHMSQDGPDLANAVVWRQIIEDCTPTWVITTGTGGGIGSEFEVGDVIVSRFVTFDCQKEFIKFNGLSYACSETAPTGEFGTAQSLFAANAHLLPKDNARPPMIVSAASPETGVLTTDFFGFDNTANTYQLDGKGELSEIGDAVLGMVCQELGSDAPLYVIVRNVSDPQINSSGFTFDQQKQLAENIYEEYGLWSTICSAIVCWAIVAAL